jgi:hypothetical protein
MMKLKIDAEDAAICILTGMLVMFSLVWIPFWVVGKIALMIYNRWLFKYC